MADGYFLTEGDKAFLSRLRELVERNGEEAVLQVIRNQPSSEVPVTTECYVARTPVGGIPALTPGTAPTQRVRDRDGVTVFVNSDDQPGRALCDVYRVTKEESPPRRVLKPVPLLAQWVYNHTPAPIPENAWVPVVRDKFGGWFPAAAGGEQGTRPVSVIDGPYSGYYVGIIDARNEGTLSWDQTPQAVAVIGYNDEPLEVGRRYKASKVAPADGVGFGLPVYAVQPIGSGGAAGSKVFLASGPSSELLLGDPGGTPIPWHQVYIDTTPPMITGPAELDFGGWGLAQIHYWLNFRVTGGLPVLVSIVAGTVAGDRNLNDEVQLTTTFQTVKGSFLFLPVNSPLYELRVYGPPGVRVAATGGGVVNSLIGAVQVIPAEGTVYPP